MRFRVIGLSLDGRMQLVRGLIKFALLPQRNPQSVVNVGLTRVQLSGFLEFGHSIRKLILQLQC